VFVNSSFTGFSITAPNIISGLVPWSVTGEDINGSGAVPGPIAYKIE